jgi:predicted nucleic acid-binding protein
MMKSPQVSLLVIDANLALRTIFPIGDGAELQLMEGWRHENRPVFAPDIWLAETTSVIRRLVYSGAITAQEGRRAVQDMFALGVQVIAADASLCMAAYQWAERLSQSKAYDGFYLALAERLSLEKECLVEFWTSDRRLFNQAQQAGVTWVRQP